MHYYSKKVMIDKILNLAVKIEVKKIEQPSTLL